VADEITQNADGSANVSANPIVVFVEVEEQESTFDYRSDR